MSLISAYSSISIFDNIGAFSITNINTADVLLEHNTTAPFKNLSDLITRCINKYVYVGINNKGQIYFELKRANKIYDYVLTLSPSASWSFGFQNTKYTFPKVTKENPFPRITCDYEHVPITIRYLQIICKNVCGTSDSNMTMPTCLGIMHITNNFTLINPHIAVNHRIIDIEILDQDNNPFIWKPVYFEFFITESAEHEKKQGFFRLEKPYVIHLHSPVKMISIPEFFFYLPTFTINYKTGAKITMEHWAGEPFRPFEATFDPFTDPFLQSLRGSVITKENILIIIAYLNQFIIQNTLLDGVLPGDIITAEFKGNDLILNTRLNVVTISPSIIGAYRPDNNSDITLTGGPVTVKYPPSIWYNKDSRIAIYCCEFHNRYPIIVARRIGECYQIINPVYWAWHQLPKATNELHFRAEEIITSPYGATTVQPLEVDEGLLQPIFKLFYK